MAERLHDVCGNVGVFNRARSMNARDMQKHTTKRKWFSFGPRMMRRGGAVLIALTCVLGFSLTGWAQTENVLYSFNGGSDGALPITSLVADAWGNYYGTASLGGSFAGNLCAPQGCGVVFQLSPDSMGGWRQKVIYTFMGKSDGMLPLAGLAMDAKGNLYGTAAAGGSFQGSDCADYGCGVVFQLRPNEKGGWVLCVLRRFQGGKDGFSPYGPLVFDAQGNFYGTTPVGGYYRNGEVFKMSPDGYGGWKYSIVHFFTGRRDGGFPSQQVAVDAWGNVFASTDEYGGNCAYGIGCGSLTELSPNSAGGYTPTVLYVFQGGMDGGTPGGLTLDKYGNLYGAAFHGGSLSSTCLGESDGEGCGVVFKLSPKSGGGWRGEVLYTFQGSTDGALPSSALTIDRYGNLFGTTQSGGDSNCNYCGVVYELSPTHGGTWVETTLHVFTGGNDGAEPGSDGVTLDAYGNLFGAAQNGGDACFLSAGCGVLYEITP